KPHRYLSTHRVAQSQPAIQSSLVKSLPTSHLGLILFLPLSIFQIAKLFARVNAMSKSVVPNYLPPALWTPDWICHQSVPARVWLGLLGSRIETHGGPFLCGP